MDMRRIALKVRVVDVDMWMERSQFCSDDWINNRNFCLAFLTLIVLLINIAMHMPIPDVTEQKLLEVDWWYHNILQYDTIQRGRVDFLMGVFQ